MKSVKVHRVITVHGTAEEIIDDLLQRLNGEDPETTFKADIQPAPVVDAFLPGDFHVFPLEVPGVQTCIVAPKYWEREKLIDAAKAWRFCGEHILTLPNGTQLKWSN